MHPNGQKMKMNGTERHTQHSNGIPLPILSASEQAKRDAQIMHMTLQNVANFIPKNITLNPSDLLLDLPEFKKEIMQKDETGKLVGTGKFVEKSTHEKAQALARIQAEFACNFAQLAYGGVENVASIIVDAQKKAAEQATLRGTDAQTVKPNENE